MTQTRFSLLLKISQRACCFQVSPGLAGLNNLGNTCFMNSALQCLSNTVQLTNYFLSNDYIRDINKTVPFPFPFLGISCLTPPTFFFHPSSCRKNPLGMKGILAEHYGVLMKQLWSAKYKGKLASPFVRPMGHLSV